MLFEYKKKRVLLNTALSFFYIKYSAGKGVNWSVGSVARDGKAPQSFRHFQYFQYSKRGSPSISPKSLARTFPPRRAQDFTCKVDCVILNKSFIPSE